MVRAVAVEVEEHAFGLPAFKYMGTVAEPIVELPNLLAVVAVSEEVE
jgi:hypothetical protein